MVRGRIGRIGRIEHGGRVLRRAQTTWNISGNCGTIDSPMPETFILVPGRTSKQGCGISEGKFAENYVSETNVLQIAPQDMERLSLSDGDQVRLTSATGQIEVRVTTARKDELPPGLLFIAYGDLSSRLMAGDTHGSGMPTSKGLDVELEVVAND